MAHADLDELLNALLPFAQQMLAAHGEFYPFAATMDPSGKVASVAFDVGEERPPSADLIALAMAAFRAQAARGEIRAAGLALDVRVLPPNHPEQVDAICARLWHASGESVQVYVPYRRGLLGRVKYGDLFATKGELAIFDTA